MAPLLAQKSGVDRAFERLYRRHAVDVYRYAVAVLHNQADAEDVTQTTFMNAYRALERGETPQSPQNWLIAIAHNVCRQRFRRAARRVQEVGLADDVADTFVRPEDDDTPSAADIRRALGHLAFNQRAALVMRELEGRSYAEIADLLDLTVSAVETLIFRARRALREQLAGALTCGQAEQLLSRQLDGELTKPDRGQLRAHLRECDGCRRIARSQRAQRSALRAIGTIPLPSSLASLFGSGVSVGAAVAVKAAAVVITAGVVGGVGYDVHHALGQPAAKHHRHAAVVRTRSVAPPAPRLAVSHVPVVATAVAAPVHRRTAPKREHHHGNPHTPVVVEAATPPAPAAVDPSATKQQGKGKGHAKTNGQGRRTEVGKSHGQATKEPGTETGAPASDGQSSQDHGKSGESHGKKDAVPAPVTDLPLIATDALTQTSQNSSARIDPVRHLQP